MDLFAKLVFFHFGVFLQLEVTLACLFSHLVKLGFFSIRNAELPLRANKFLDVASGKVRHFLLNLVEYFIFEEALSTEWLIRHFERFDLLLKLPNFVLSHLVGRRDLRHCRNV